jgi:hypothetical protein
MTKILKRLFLLATVLAPIQASADTITLAATGYLTDGWDYINAFGLYNPQVGPTGSMAGQNYMATYVFDTSIGSTVTWAGGEYVYGSTSTNPLATNPNPSPALSASLAINGITVLLPTNYGQLVMSTNGFYAVVDGDPNGGIELDNGAILSTNVWSNVTPHFSPSWDNFSISILPTDAQQGMFRLGDVSQPQAYGHFVTETITLTNSPASVPGPVVGAGLPGLGAAALLWLARRRQKRNFAKSR